ncbi:MAG: DUF1634 domain-containing protein [Firmicutes bacterium]|nr:DUF1634 domain-containing protein [Bacillota bacterium]
MAPQENTPAKKSAHDNVETPPEQVAYAHLLQYCSWIGIVVLSVTFLLYITGILTPFIPPSDMPLYWHLPVNKFLAATHDPRGWDWVLLWNRGEYLSLFGIVFLAGLTIIGYLFLLLPAYLRKKDWIYTAIVAVEVILLVLAASGLIVIAG